MTPTIQRHVPLKRSQAKRTSSKVRRRQRGWSAIVQAAIAAVNGVCQIQVDGLCTFLATEGHHRLPRGRGGKDTRENCVVGCRACHDWVHEHPAMEKGFLQSSSIQELQRSD